jgi:hypothetical protein
MACEINASPSNGLVQSADGSGIIKLKSNGVTTNALAWVNFNGTGTVAIRSSYNVSSITDNGTGDYTVNFSTALSDANYVASCSTIGSIGQAATDATWVNPYSMSTSNVAIRTNWYTTNLIDRAFVMVTIHGN